MVTQLPPPPWQQPGRKQRKRAPLSQEQIVDAALRILDAEGLEAVSMRRIADELKTGPASLYAHVANKEQLLELASERVLSEIPLMTPDPNRWQEQLRELCTDSIKALTAHNDIAKVLMGTIPTGYHALRIADTMLGIMLAGGIPPRVAALASDTIGLYINAQAFEGTLYRQRLVEGEEGADFAAHYIAQVAGYLRSLPVEQFPHLTAHVDDMTEAGGEERFQFGIDLFIRSLESYVP